MKNMQQYYGPNYSVEDIRDGERVPVGGTNILNGIADLHLEADFKTLEPFFEKI